MNRNLFSIILLFCILAQIIDAHHHHHHHHHHYYFNNRCTVTKTSSETVTVSQCSDSQIPTPTSKARKRHYNHHHYNHDCNHHKPTKTVIHTPTVTVCPDCCERGGPGFQNVIASGGGSVSAKGITTAEDCCRACVANPACLQWIFSDGLCHHNVPGNSCTGSLVPVNNSGMIRCPGKGCLPPLTSLAQINSDAGPFPPKI